MLKKISNTLEKMILRAFIKKETEIMDKLAYYIEYENHSKIQEDAMVQLYNVRLENVTVLNRMLNEIVKKGDKMRKPFRTTLTAEAKRDLKILSAIKGKDMNEVLEELIKKEMEVIKWK